MIKILPMGEAMENGEEIAPGIRVIYGHAKALGICSNVYLLEGEEGPLMIDSGNGELKLAKPARVILTHGHFDHTKGVKEGWNAYLHPADIAEATAPPYWKPPNVKPLALAPMKWGTFELEFIHTPGHTPGSVCVLEKRSRMLFSGDTIFPEGGQSRTDLKGGDEKAMAKTLAMLKKLDYKTLCAGHGEMEKR